MRRVRWGVLSTARIGLLKVIPGMPRGEFCGVTSVASRDLAAARAAADRLGLRKAYGSYDELLADPDVDAVYIPLCQRAAHCRCIEATAAGAGRV